MRKLTGTESRRFCEGSNAIGLFVATLIAGLLQSCVIPADPLQKTLHVGRGEASDTISPYGGISLGFSVPADDSVLPRFVFNPPVFSYTVVMNTARDTARLAWFEPLAGARHYVISIDEFVAVSGERMSSDDSIVFVTYPMEKEPNDTRETADTLTTRRWGAIATVNDTDWFAATVPPGDALVLNSTGSRTSFSVSGQNGLPGPERMFRKSDTIHIADTFPSPLNIAVFASNRSVGGYYELGRVTLK